MIFKHLKKATKWFGSPNSKSVNQAASIDGDGNTIIQNSFHLNTDKENAIDSKTIEALANNSQTSPRQQNLYQSTDTFKNLDNTDEIKRIKEYRKIATEGENNTAIKLLTNLLQEDVYRTNPLKFQVLFNIGMIQQNIGETALACDTLKTAYESFPDNKKAKAGLAFADLLNGNDAKAHEVAVELLKDDGEHVNFAAFIALNSARASNLKFDISQYPYVDTEQQDVKIASLEFKRVSEPDRFHNILSQEYEKDKTNEAVAYLWALSILDDAKENQAFLLGAKMPTHFNENLKECAKIFETELVKSLRQKPINKNLLSTHANNAAVALRLVGDTIKASNLLDQTLEIQPEAAESIAQIRAVLLLIQDKETEALNIIQALTNYPDLQLMASEIEAKQGKFTNALIRVNETLNCAMSDELRFLALNIKTKIGLNSGDRAASDEALEELNANFADHPQTLVLKAAYSRAFESRTLEVIDNCKSNNESMRAESELLSSLEDSADWDFDYRLQVADELFENELYRECVNLLVDRTSFMKESPALATLCDACIQGGMASKGTFIRDNLGPEVKESVFGWKFISNIGYLTGEIQKIIPVTRKLFEKNSNSIGSLIWYVQALMRNNEKSRVSRIVGKLDDDKMTGTTADMAEYVKLLVFCDQISRARTFAYRLFCENRNDQNAWTALSSSVLAIGKPEKAEDDLSKASVEIDVAFEVLRPDGQKQRYIIEEDQRVFSLRDENIDPKHKIAEVALGKKTGEDFKWPFSDQEEIAQILSIKHKALDAFHVILQRFEEQFPNASGFKSFQMDLNQESGLDDIKSVLKNRSDYAQKKASEYQQNSLPISILAYSLGINPIDAFMGLKNDCGYNLKVSTCSHADQHRAKISLRKAVEQGLLVDSITFNLIRRLELGEIIEKKFGKIGITQTTIDVLSLRLAEAETVSYFESEDGVRRAGSMSINDGQILISEVSESEMQKRIGILKSDLDWAKNACQMVPAAAKKDPDEVIIRFRDQHGGKFLDDLFAADGSDRMLLAEDFHLRQFASELFELETAWLQEMLYYLEANGDISILKALNGTIYLHELGEDALSIDVDKLINAAHLLVNNELSKLEFEVLCRIIGQNGAELQSHISVAALTILGLWKEKKLGAVREYATSQLLTNLIRNQKKNYGNVLDDIEAYFRSPLIRKYIANWRTGHFLN